MEQTYITCSISDLYTKFQSGECIIYEKQRVMDLIRVDEIYEFFRKTPKIRGVFAFAVYKGKYYLIDGQHRYSACEKLFLTDQINLNVCCENIHVNSMDEIFEEFTLINKSVPVPIHIFHNTIILEQFIKYVKEKYPSALGTKKRIPVMREDDFRDQLCLLTGHTLSSFIEKLENTEKKYKEQSTQESFLHVAAGYDKKKMAAVKNALKNMKGKLYIGLLYNTSWIDEFRLKK